MYKVILVDDEYLSLDYFSQLLIWEKYGFHLSKTFTKPIEAFEYCKKNKVDIVITDVRMPNMNGVDLCKGLLNKKHTPKFIMLTAYRDFEFLHQAMQLGVSSFILKHECDSKLLLEELTKISGQLDSEEQKNRVVKRQFIRDILRGMEAKEPSISSILGYASNTQYVFFIIKRDAPYPILEYKQDDQYYSVKWHKTLLRTGYEYVGTVNLSPHLWGMLLNLTVNFSAREFIEYTYSIAYSLQNIFGEQFLDTVSVAFSDPFSNINDIVKWRDRLETTITMNIYYGKSKIFTNMYQLNQPSDISGILNKGLEEIGDKMTLNSIGELKMQIVSLFSIYIQYKYPSIELKRLCRKLVELLDSYRQKYYLKTLEEIIAEGNLEYPECYHIHQLQEWFTGQYESAVFEANKLVDKMYSGKIQKIIQFIHSNYQNNYTIYELASMFNISSDYLRHIFKEETGQTIMNFITLVKIDRAKELLESRKYKIYEVAEATGFSTSQYFSYVFKKVTGVNPTDYADYKEE